MNGLDLFFSLQWDLVSLFTTHLSPENKRGILGLVSGCPKGVTGMISWALQLGTQERNGSLLSAKQMLGKAACAALPRVDQTHVSEPKKAMSVNGKQTGDKGRLQLGFSLLTIFLYYFIFLTACLCIINIPVNINNAIRFPFKTWRFGSLRGFFTLDIFILFYALCLKKY